MPSIIGYTDRISAAPGDTVRFMVSAEGVRDYRAEIVRVICGDASPAGPGFKVKPVRTAIDGTYTAREQPIHIGSYAVVPPSPAMDAIASFTMQAMVMPTLPEQPWQAIMGRWVEPSECGFFLYMDDKAQLCVGIGDGKGGTRFLRSGVPMLKGIWYLCAASFDATTGTLKLWQEPQASLPGVEPAAVSTSTEVRPGTRKDLPFLIGAWSEDGRKDGGKVGAHFNGRIDDPVLCRVALDRAGVLALRHGPIPPALAGDVLGAWDFARDMASDRIHDTGPYNHHGRLVNLPTRAVRDSLWTGECMDWTRQPGHYGAIHFHEDDLYDAGWQADFELAIPQDMRSGFYAARLTSGATEGFISFFVRPPRGTTTAKLALLVPTASYMAYANPRWHYKRTSEVVSGHFTVLQPVDMFLLEHPGLGRSTYDTHEDGSGVSISSRLRPILNMRPKSGLWQYAADTHITDWLEAKGIAYDVITDEDLHAEGLGLVENYACVMTGSHPEYYSTPMWDALWAYTRRGGRLIYTGANGFYWRIAYHPELPGVIEIRRAEDGSRAWAAEPGEYVLSFTGEWSGMWRRSGRPPQALVGTGFIAQGFDLSSYYVRQEGSHDPRAAFIFEGVATNGRIGDFGSIGGGAAGLELDWVDFENGTPPHTLVLASSEGHTSNYLLVNEEVLFNHTALSGEDNEQVHADMTFFETTGGGAVFSTSSIAWAGSLAHNNYDNNVSRITENVVRRFIDPTPFVYPAPRR